MLQGLLLGLSNGAVCIGNCAPVILPYMLSGGKTVQSNFIDLFIFLAGRFSGYLVFAALAFFTRKIIFRDPVLGGRFMAVSAALLGAALIFYNLWQSKRKCEWQRKGNLLKNRFIGNLRCYPWVLGLITGINICPPFLLVFTEAINSNSLGKSISFLSAFFVGTSVFFIPFPFIGSLAQNDKIKTLGEATLYLTGGYYLVKGIISLGSVG